MRRTLRRWVIRVGISELSNASWRVNKFSVLIPFSFMGKLNCFELAGAVARIINYTNFLQLCLFRFILGFGIPLPRSRRPKSGLNYATNFPFVGFLLIYSRVVGSNCTGISCPEKIFQPDKPQQKLCLFKCDPNEVIKSQN